LVLSIISTWHLKDLSGVTICDQIKGLVLFGNPNYPGSDHSISDLLYQSRGSSKLAYDTEASFVQSIFQENLLPKLRFLEVSEANDHAVAAMVSAPNLQQLIVREDYWSLTNEGFGHLVGSRWWASPSSCHSVSSRVIHCARQSPRTISWLRSRLCAGNGKESDLQHMALGKK
jgi:hypothetical protein